MAVPRLLLLNLAATMVAASPAAAWHRHHRPIAPPAAHAAFARRPTVYPAGGWQAEAIARATARMQAAPGVANELSPDAKETATGGPSGGVPEFSGD